MKKDIYGGNLNFPQSGRSPRVEKIFSEWGNYSKDKANHKLEESYEKVEKKEMPITPYLITHADARLTEEQRAQLVTFFKSKMK